MFLLHLYSFIFLRFKLESLFELPALSPLHLDVEKITCISYRIKRIKVNQVKSNERSWNGMAVTNDDWNSANGECEC